VVGAWRTSFLVTGSHLRSGVRATGGSSASPDQRGTLAQIARDNRHLYRGYLMKEQLRQIFAPDTVSGRALLAGLISWPEFGHFLSA